MSVATLVTKFSREGEILWDARSADSRHWSHSHGHRAAPMSGSELTRDRRRVTACHRAGCAQVRRDDNAAFTRLDDAAARDADALSADDAPFADKERSWIAQ